MKVWSESSTPTYLSVKEKKNVNEKFLISSVKGVKIEVTQEFLSQALNIPNEGKRLFSSFRNKLNEQGEVIRNKTRLVAQGYNQ